MSSIAVYNQFRIEIYIQHSIRIEKKITREMTWTKNVGNIDPWFVEAQIHGGVESEFLLQMNQQVSYSARNGLIIII
jgi:hypothetical protein